VLKKDPLRGKTKGGPGEEKEGKVNSLIWETVKREVPWLVTLMY